MRRLRRRIVLGQPLGLPPAQHATFVRGALQEASDRAAHARSLVRSGRCDEALAALGHAAEVAGFGAAHLYSTGYQWARRVDPQLQDLASELQTVTNELHATAKALMGSRCALPISRELPEPSTPMNDLARSLVGTLRKVQKQMLSDDPFERSNAYDSCHQALNASMALARRAAECDGDIRWVKRADRLFEETIARCAAGSPSGAWKPRPRRIAELEVEGAALGAAWPRITVHSEPIKRKRK